MGMVVVVVDIEVEGEDKMKIKTWYLADLIVSINIKNDSTNVVHINTLLVHAYSNEDAYDKTLILGKEEETEYKNSDGNKVTIKFEGIGDIYEIMGDLEHGTEIIYEEKINISKEKIATWIRKKDELSIFSSPEKKDTPNYIPKEIYDAMIEDGFTKEELK